ncbi:RNA polymerase sigma factor [Methylocaldum sp. MU1018]
MNRTRRHRLLDSLLRRHGKELLAFAGQKSDRESAEDLVQEAYLRLLQHPDLDAIENHRAYLYRIMSNLGADLFRRRQIRGETLPEEDVDLEAVACPRAEPDDAADKQLRLQRCLEALESLPEIHRHVFLLHRVDGMTHAEIGEALQIPRRTVERYCARALAHCHKHLTDDAE